MPPTPVFVEEAVLDIVGDSFVSTFSSFFDAAASCSAMVSGFAALAPDNFIFKAGLAPFGIAGGFAFRFSPFLHVGNLIAIFWLFKDGTVGVFADSSFLFKAG